MSGASGETEVPHNGLNDLAGRNCRPGPGDCAVLLAFDIWVVLAMALACNPVFLTSREIARYPHKTATIVQRLGERLRSRPPGKASNLPG